MFDFFKRKDSVALDIQPHLRFVDSGREIRVILNSGPEDLNQTSWQKRLSDEQSAEIVDIHVAGFDRIYTSLTSKKAADKQQDEALVKATPQKEEPIDAEVKKSSGVKSVGLGYSSEMAVEASAKKVESTEPLKEEDEKNVILSEDKVEETELEKVEPKSVAQLLDVDDVDPYFQLSISDLHGQIESKDATKVDEYAARKLVDLVEDAFDHEEGIMIGEIFLELAGGEMLSIAKPVYVVIPSEVDGDLEFVETQDARDYIEGEWKEVFSEALIGMTDPAYEMGSAPVRARSRDSGEASETVKRYAAPLAGGVLLVAATLAGASWFNKDQSATNPTSITSALGDLGAAPLMASSNNSGGLLEAPRLPTAEEYAAMQNAATDEILSKMNIDINDTADLGCLTQ